jgi:dolichol-phosphate mannosyltransferase
MNETLKIWNSLMLNVDPSTPARDSLSILVPTRNEAANVEELLRRISTALAGISCEVLFIDDSDDDTPAAIQAVAASGGAAHLRVALLARRGDQRWGGLGGAVVDGLRAARSPWACVMDADLQHPPEVVPALVAKADREGADLVIASRHCDQGRAAGLNAGRTVISRGSTIAARTLFPRRLRGVSDPMSGFFLVRRDAIDLDRLQPRGFKILLELLVQGGNLRTAEVGYSFASRYAGESKGSLSEGLTYLQRLCELRLDLREQDAGPAREAPAVQLITAGSFA